jgi:hypothetical protein
MDIFGLDIWTLIDKGLSLTNALGAVVTAGATIVLAKVTRTLTDETRRLRKQSGSPDLVIYVDIDFEKEGQPIVVVLGNVGQAAAHNVKIEYSPNNLIKVMKGEAVDGRMDFRFSELPFNELPFIPPEKSYIAHFSAVNDGTGAINRWIDIDETATLSYENKEGEKFTDKIKITSDSLKFTRITTSKGAPVRL